MGRPVNGYRLKDGTKPTSVTTALKMLGFGSEQLIGWANKLGREGKSHNDVLKHAGRVGSCAHDRIEAILAGTLFDETKWTPEELAEAAPCVELFKQWRVGKRIRVVAAELPMISETYRIGGTLDLVARINNGPLQLIDFKTSSHIYESHIAQVAGYIDMVADVLGKTIPSALIVRFGKDGVCEELVVDGDMLERGRRLFHIARELKAMELDLRKDLATAVKPFAGDVVSNWSDVTIMQEGVAS